MPSTPQQERRSPGLWNILGQRMPESEVVFISQVILVYTVIITCIVNLSLQKGDSSLWICLMSSCLGYLLPNPKIDTAEKRTHHFQHGTDVPDFAQQQL